jgi:CRISPR-associated protein Cas2
MWLLVMFDLPVSGKADKREATRFRQWLLDQGYERSQLSIYMRFCVGREQMDRRVREIGNARPRKGTVHILAVTDKQFEQMVVFRGGDKDRGPAPPNQLELF